MGRVFDVNVRSDVDRIREVDADTAARRRQRLRRDGS